VIENVALLGLSCAFNPVLFGIVLLTLASERPKRMLGAYFAGAFTWSVGLGIGIVTIASGADAFGGRSSPSRPIFDLVAGGALLVGAYWYGTGRAARRKARRAAGGDATATAAATKAGAAKAGKPQKAPLPERLLSGSVPLAFIAGVVLNFPSVRYIEAMKEIVVANVSSHERILAILLFNVLMLSPAIVPLVLLAVRPEGTRTVMTRIDTWLRLHAQILLTAVLIVFGLYLIAKGVVGLA
jgi:hypothetical protein